MINNCDNCIFGSVDYDDYDDYDNAFYYCSKHDEEMEEPKFCEDFKEVEYKPYIEKNQECDCCKYLNKCIKNNMALNCTCISDKMVHYMRGIYGCFKVNENELKVFRCLANAKISTYMSMYSPSRAVISSKYIATSCGLSIYKTRKIIKSLVDKGLIERVSCGRPAVVSYGEIAELECEAMPPLNGFALTKKAFETEEWKEMYENWEKSLAEWANE